MPFKELYTVSDCARFLANYILYEPLADPLKPPEVLPSPATVLQWRIADSYDLAFVLASYLLGNGYDAYVVFGTAPRWVTLRDQRRVDCPYTEEDFSTAVLKGAGAGGDADAADGGEETLTGKYKPAFKGVPESKFLTDMMRKTEEEKAAAAARAANEEQEVELPELPDPLEGRRVHAWVLVRAGARDVEEHTYVEPVRSTLTSST